MKSNYFNKDKSWIHNLYSSIKFSFVLERDNSFLISTSRPPADWLIPPGGALNKVLYGEAPLRSQKI